MDGLKTQGKTYHLACSCMDNTYWTDLNCTSKPWASTQSNPFSINTISAVWSKCSPPPLKMNSSLWHLARKTDYISPDTSSFVQILALWTEGLDRVATHRKETGTEHFKAHSPNSNACICNIYGYAKVTTTRLCIAGLHGKWIPSNSYFIKLSCV